MKAPPRAPTQRGAGFTLLEILMALMLLATAVGILVTSQATAVHLQDEAAHINTATMLAREIMTELDLRMAKEGFGENDVKEAGTFDDERFGGQYDGYRWEYEVEKVEVELPNLGNLMNLLSESGNEAGEAMGVPTGGQAPAEVQALDALGFDGTMLSDMMANYLREARVRVCWKPGRGAEAEEDECLEVITHLANPTGRVLTAEEQLALDQVEDATGMDPADVFAGVPQGGGGGGGDGGGGRGSSPLPGGGGTGLPSGMRSGGLTPIGAPK